MLSLELTGTCCKFLGIATKKSGSSNYRTSNHHNRSKETVMTSPKANPNDVFWLARYAHNQVAPLIEQAKAIEPSLHFNIQINLTDDHPVFRCAHINIGAHWDRDGMFQYSSILDDKAAVDRFAAKVAADVAALRPLETGIAA